MNVLNLLIHLFAEPISTLMLEKLYQTPTFHQSRHLH